jgi:hypothetical protein
MKKVNAVVSFIPLVIYCGYLSVMQMRVGGHFFVTYLLLSLLPTCVLLLYFRIVIKKSVPPNIRLLLTLSAGQLFVLGYIASVVGSDTESASISGIAVYTITVFAYVFISFAKLRTNSVLADFNTGITHLDVGGDAHRLPEYGASSSNISVSGERYAVVVKSDLAETPINPSSGLPMYHGVSGPDVGGNSWGNTNVGSGHTINPTSGLPMNGGTSGIDVGGNSWGTTFNDPTSSNNSYDPNRGY